MEVHYLDATSLKAHQHAAGAKGGTRKSETLGYSQGGFSTKIHLRAEGGGTLMVFSLSEGQRKEVGFWPLMDNAEVHRAGRGVRSYARGVSALTRATPRGWSDAIRVWDKDNHSQKDQRASRRSL